MKKNNHSNLEIQKKVISQQLFIFQCQAMKTDVKLKKSVENFK